MSFGISDDVPFLFRATVDLTPQERERYFNERHVAPGVRSEVESLIGFDAQAPDPITECVAGAAEDLLVEEPDVRIHERCGAYEITGVIAHGGMGAVYLAERADGEIKQRVAIKLIRHASGTAVLNEYFLRERQILASLHHPGIAPLLDAGRTAGGQPYLVMEYVDGVPLDVFCRGLSFRGKLELFLKVCDAVSYAHRNLVIHRDLKPSNILTDAQGQPRLLDFGIARIMEETADAGLTRERILTPEYASPEQIRGWARSTSTDIYSLGAVFYFILTGRPPHNEASGNRQSIEEIVCKVEAETASRVNPALPRDMDFVLAKALRKEPEQRYASVEELADDLHAILESRPVKARAGSGWYRTRHALRRHWRSVSAVAAVILALGAGLYVANRERASAQRRFLQVRQIANKLLSFDPDIRQLAGSTKVRQQMASAALEYLDGVGREARGDRDLELEVARGYVQLAEVQGVPVQSNLGQFAAAAGSLAKAKQFVDLVLADQGTRPDALLLAAEIEGDHMILADSQAHYDEALTRTRKSVEYLDALQATGRVSVGQKQAVARSYLNAGLSFSNAHRFDDAVRNDRVAIELIRSSGVPSYYLAQGLSALANTLRMSGDLESALGPIGEAMRVAAATSYPSQTMKDLAMYAILMRQGQILGGDGGINLNRQEEAAASFQEAFEIVDRQASQDRDDAASRDRVATAARQFADILRRRDPRRSLEIYDRAIERQRELKGNSLARREEAQLLVHSAAAMRSLGRGGEARRRVEAASELLRSSGDLQKMAVKTGSETADVLRARADEELAAGNSMRAIGVYRDLLDRLAAANATPQTDLIHADYISGIWAALERAYRAAGREEDADAFAARRLDLWRQWDRKLPNRPFVLAHLQADLNERK